MTEPTTTGPGRASVLEQVLGDLEAESAALAAPLVPLADDAGGWRRPTPAPGWDVATQVGHLDWTDDVAALAARAAAGDGRGVGRRRDGRARRPDGFVDAPPLSAGDRPATEVLAAGRRARADLAAALRALPGGTRMPWFGPPMSATSMATAPLHGDLDHAHDVREALGAAPDRPTGSGTWPTSVSDPRLRLRRARRPVPEAEVRVELVAPSGARWTWGRRTRSSA